MSTRNLRSSSRNPVTSDNNQPRDSATTSAPQNIAPVISTNAVTPLMSIRFPPGFGPQTHSSPESEITIRTPTYSSITAREISGQGSRPARRDSDNMDQQDRELPPIREEVNPGLGVDEEGVTIREYVAASVGAAQASIMREVQHMQLMLPQLIRESLRSERSHFMDQENPPNPRQFNPNQDFRTPFNNNDRHQPPFRPPNNPQMPFQRRLPQPHVPQQLFGNSPQNYFEPASFDNSPHNHGYNPISPNQLEKWGIKYDGTNKSLTVEDFVFRVEILRHDYNCSWDTVMKGFHHLVTGAASTWFWAFRMKHPICDWTTFKYHLIRKFRNFESDFEIQRKIMERRQAPNETADAFITEIIKLKNQMRIHVLESELVKIVKDNLKDGLAQLVFPIKIDNLDQLLEECKRAERNIAKRFSQRTPLGNTRRVYEVDVFDGEPNDDQARLVEELQKVNLAAKQLICWNCKTPGHSFIECPVTQRRIFCYKCGFEDVTSPTCPKCVGNTKANTQRTGPACSFQNPTQ